MNEEYFERQLAEADWLLIKDQQERIAFLTSLCARAADALEGTLPEKITFENADFYSKAEKTRSYLIAELRKAAE